MERSIRITNVSRTRCATRFAFLNVACCFAWLLAAVWSGQAMASLGCEIQPISATTQSGPAGTNLTFTFGIVNLGGCPGTVRGTMVSGSDTTGGALATPTPWSGAPGSTISINLALGPTSGGQAVFTAQCSSDCFSGNTSIALTGRTDDDYSLVASTATSVTGA